jgi:hypothetical protein
MKKKDQVTPYYRAEFRHFLDVEMPEALQRAHAFLERFDFLHRDISEFPGVTANKEPITEESLLQLLQSHWAFFCFADEPWWPLGDLIQELYHSGIQMRIRMIAFPEGRLGIGRSCRAVFLPKDAVTQEVLWACLRKHLGYDQLNPNRSVFTLGLSAAEEAMLKERDSYLEE